MSNHAHTRKDELGVFWIPADTDLPMEYKVIENHWRALGALVEGYIEVVRTEFIPELYCGCHMVMVVNEDGIAKGLTQNLRIEQYYPFQPIYGNAVLVGEGLVAGDGYDEPDMFSLPPALHDWEGPGNPLPPQVDIGN